MARLTQVKWATRENTEYGVGRYEWNHGWMTDDGLGTKLE